jgi:hypothetical protein
VPYEGGVTPKHLMSPGLAVVGMFIVALMGCGSPPDNATPRAVAERVVAALDAGDAGAFLDTLPSDADLERTFDCSRGNSLRGALQRRREDAPAEFAARRHAGHRVRLVRFDQAGTTSVELVPGDSFQGCTVLKAVMAHRSRVELSLSKSGRMDFDQETWTFLRFSADGPWTFARL